MPHRRFGFSLPSPSAFSRPPKHLCLFLRFLRVYFSSADRKNSASRQPEQRPFRGRYGSIAPILEPYCLRLLLVAFSSRSSPVSRTCSISILKIREQPY